MKIIKDSSLNARIASADKNRILKKHGSVQNFLDLCLELDKRGILKPLDRALYEIERDSTGDYLKELKKQIGNKKASDEWQDFDECSDSLDKKVQQLKE